MEKHHLLKTLRVEDKNMKYIKNHTQAGVMEHLPSK
jgi:hypothetical protein